MPIRDTSGRPSHCPRADEAHDGFANFYLFITLLITYNYDYCLAIIKIFEENMVNFQYYWTLFDCQH